VDPNAFIGEVYRRMALRMPSPKVIEVDEFAGMGQRYEAWRRNFYMNVLPADRAARIVDVGSGDAEYIALCNALGYRDVTAVDFRASAKLKKICAVYPNIHAIDLQGTIGDHFGLGKKQYDVVHLSHVIEHIPKYSLLYAVDALYKSLSENGLIIVRCPNMEGPCALSSYYVTLAHEYGFAGSNLKSLLNICGFEEITFHNVHPRGIGRVVRWPILLGRRINHRLFGVNVGGQFGAELVVTARRRSFPPLFDERFR
jgi:2-polyprenyl-3-methyl-5-hydroxy-6-metoxy-1,4-benzoquinol methylase